MNLLKVDSIENGKDKTGVGMQTIKFVKAVSDANGEIFSAEKPRTRVIFAERTLADGTKIAAHPLYGKLSKGARVLGTIESLETSPYTPEGFTKEQTKYTFVCFEGENPLGYAALQLRDYSAGPIDPTSKQAIILEPRTRVEA